MLLQYIQKDLPSGSSWASSERSLTYPRLAAAPPKAASSSFPYQPVKYFQLVSEFFSVTPADRSGVCGRLVDEYDLGNPNFPQDLVSQETVSFFFFCPKLDLTLEFLS